VNPVALPPGCARLATKPAPTGSMTVTNTIGTLRVACSNAATLAVPDAATRTSGASATSSVACLRSSSASVAKRGSMCRLRPSLQPLGERREAGASFRIVRAPIHEHADAPHPLALLRTRRDRPRRRAAEQSDELAPGAHSITSSARALNVGGNSKPSILAVFKL